MRKFVIVVALAVGLAATYAGGPALASAQDTGALISVSVPDPARVDYGKQFDVQIMADNVANLGDFQFQLTYDDKRLEFISVGKGPFLGSSGREVTCFDARGSQAPASNVVGYACATLGPKPPAGAAGSGVLATVTFKAVSAGDVALSLSGVKLTDPPGELLPNSTKDGTITVVGSDSSINWLPIGGVIAGVALVIVLIAAVTVALKRRSPRGA